MTKPVVSVVIPVYNGEKTIERALKSVFRQEEQNLEVIIVNDGSTDGSRELLDKLAADEPRLKVIHKDNEGVSVARNTGMDAATGEYLVFLDCDDEWEPNFLERALTLLREHDVDAVRVGLRYVGTAKDRVEPLSMPSKVYSGPEELDWVKAQFGAAKDMGFSWTYVSNTDLAKNARFPAGVPCGEDLVFTYELLSNLNSVFVTDEPLYKYMGNASSATSSPANTLRNIMSMINVGSIALDSTLRSSRSDLAGEIASNRLQRTFRDLIRTAGAGSLARDGYLAAVDPANPRFRKLVQHADMLRPQYAALLRISHPRTARAWGWPVLRALGWVHASVSVVRRKIRQYCESVRRGI